MRRPARALIAAALIVGLSACSDDEPALSPATALDATTTTARATTTTGADPTTSEQRPPDDIVLRGDGLGVVALGDEPDAAVAAVTAALGDPTADTGWDSSFG